MAVLKVKSKGSEVNDDELKSKKLLVALDGSDHSPETVCYLGKLLSSADLEMVLLHVIREIDDALLDVGLTPLYHKRIAEIAAWDSTRKNAIREHMDQAYQILTKSSLTGCYRVKCLVLTTDKGSQSSSMERFGSIPVTAFSES
jgi:hypothetical protein